MPEGPSIVILREAAAGFAGRKVLRVSGNSKQNIGRMRNRKVLAVRSWGKHFLLEFTGFSLRIHFMLFGSYRINEDKETPTRLSLGFSKSEVLNFYACSVRFIEGDLGDHYDWSGDVMNDAWDPAAARRKLRTRPEALAADVLLDQNVFAGVGNIIKNEVLHRIRVHPESRVGALPPRKLAELVTQARDYSFDFYHWKKAFVLRKHYQVHTKTICPRDGTRLSYRKHLGRAQRRAFWCDTCQRLYGAEPLLALAAIAGCSEGDNDTIDDAVANPAAATDIRPTDAAGIRRRPAQPPGRIGPAVERRGGADRTARPATGAAARPGGKRIP